MKLAASSDVSGAAAPLAATDVLPSFGRFPDLPTEIRLLIWEAAMRSVPPQVLDLSSVMDEADDEDGMAFPLEPPVLTSVCRESREVALGITGGRSFVLTYECPGGAAAAAAAGLDVSRVGVGTRVATGPERPARHPRDVQVHGSLRTWFSGNLDLLDFTRRRSYDRRRPWVLDDEMYGLLGIAARIMIPATEPDDVFALVARPGVCPRPRVLDVMVERFEALDAETMPDPAAVRAFFAGGRDRLVLLDLEDVVRARAVVAALKENPPGRAAAASVWRDPPSYWVRSWYESMPSDSVSEAARRVLERVRGLWAAERVPGVRDAPERGEAAEQGEEEEARRARDEALAEMPLVRAVRCCDWPFDDLEVDNTRTICRWRDDVALKQALAAYEESTADQ
ncbi:hypothetical protein VTK73DRAFT_4951 [Phialemonium thermophilum]|uniref:2EXR domain-containing protein n=1 Tax=Phialemonium thermophilum TaxID=223376 RepID=A0ABR3WQJ6_9PEZI